MHQGAAMRDTKQAESAKPQTVRPPDPDEYQLDLNSDPMAGQNIGAAGAHPEKYARTAFDIKELHRRLRDWSDADLRELPVLPEGTRLEQDATYLDLAADHVREFTATGDMEAARPQRLVPKSDVPYMLWNRL